MTTGAKGRLQWRADRGTWEVDVELPNRGRVRKSTGFAKDQKADAQRFLDVFLRELEGTATSPSMTDPTFREWGDAWVKERKGRVVSALNEESHLEFHAYPELGDLRLSQLTKARMLAWVRGLPSHVSDRTGQPIASRSVHHVAATVRRLLSEAVDRDLLAVTPCVWKAKRDLPPKMDKDPSKRRAGGFQAAEVAALLFDPRIPDDRRVLYALEFLTGMRTGEAAARRWRDLDEQASPLPRLEVRTAYNTRVRKEKSTKTLVEKIVPVHPILATVLRRWRDDGWTQFMGRKPEPDDLIVPAERGGIRNASHSNRLFQEDLRTLKLRAAELERRTHYETRSTFRSLALAGGANRGDLDLITHPSPRQASDLYTRLDLLWPALCRVVLSVQVQPPAAEKSPTSHPPSTGTNEKSPATEDGCGAPEWRAIQDSNRRAGTPCTPLVRAPEAPNAARPERAPALTSARGAAPGGACADLPDALPAFVEADCAAALRAIAQGERSEAARVLETALRACQAPPALRVVG